MTAATTVAAGAAVDAPATALYGRVSERAAFLDVSISPEELADLAVRLDMGGRRAVRARGGLHVPGGQAPRPSHKHAAQAEPPAAESPQDLRGVRLRPHTRPGRRRAAQAAGAIEPARTEEPCVHRTRWNWEDPPCASLRQGVLPGGLQDILPQGDRAS